MSQEKCPTEVRLSDHFLLSDLMGCHSVYAKGYRNVFNHGGVIQADKLREGRTLARKLLEPLVRRSRLSVTYGYISPELSRKIVKYQDPDKPSYHRWDAGAACDVVLHNYLHTGLPPICAACWIDENLPVSRTITYSESPCICVATRAEEVAKGLVAAQLLKIEPIETQRKGKPKHANQEQPPTPLGRTLTLHGCTPLLAARRMPAAKLPACPH